MNNKEFEKTITTERLAKSDNSDKFMSKSYLRCLLNGGILWEPCFIYNCFKLKDLSQVQLENEALKFGLEDQNKSMINLFNFIKKQGFWTSENTEVKYYDQEGFLIDMFDRSEYAVISRSEETTKKITYFLDKSNKIRPYKSNIKKTIAKTEIEKLKTDEKKSKKGMWITVNGLTEILKKHYGTDFNITEIEVANMNNQHYPERKKVNIGGVLNIHLEE